MQANQVIFVVLRFMRRPILVLITVYAVSMVGWILIPGVDEAGEPQRLSFFHAFYFLTYTVTTTGFGELPNTFTEAQRMWGIVSLYAGVIAWFYALGSIVGLVQNREFQRSVAERSFAKRIARVSEPYFIVCGFGNTGALLTRGLSDAGKTVVVIDRNPERISTAMMRDYPSEVMGLCADARVPEHLIEAGILKANCKAVVALTQDEEVNLKIAVTARLLNAGIWAVTQSTSAAHEDTLSTLGANVHIVDPFQTYAKYLGATIKNPKIHTLNQWLAGTPEASLDDTLSLPRGEWILCGFGRMGRWIRDALEAESIATTVIEPDPGPEAKRLENLVEGRASQETLIKAGAKTAVGVVAGTNNDSDNLSILLNARALNSDIFFVVRQNKYRNQVVFRAGKADLIMMPSMVSARRILFLLIAPLLKTFFETLRERDAAEADYIDTVIARLQERVGGTRPRLWTVEIDQHSAAAVAKLSRAGHDVSLAHLISDPVDPGRQLACLPLVLRRGADQSTTVLPKLDSAVAHGDQVLFCGRPRAYRLLEATMNNEYALIYIMTGQEVTRSVVLRWLAQRFPRLETAGG